MKNFITVLYLVFFAGIINAQTVIVDLGAGTLYAGLSTSTAPTVTISHSFAPEGDITDWNGFETTLTQMFSQLGVQSKDCSVLVTVQPLTHNLDAQKMTTVLFEKFNIQKLYLMGNSVGALYSQGSSTGIVMNIEKSLSRIIPTYNGLALPHAVITIPALSGEIIQNNHEAMYNTSLIGLNIPGLHEMTYDAIMKCDVDIRKDMYINIVIAGDHSNIPDIGSRTRDLIDDLAPPTMTVNVNAPSDRDVIVWKGAQMGAVSVLTDISFWLTKAEFDSGGAVLIHTKFHL